MDSKTLTPTASASQNANARPATPIAAPKSALHAKRATLRPSAPTSAATPVGAGPGVARAAYRAPTTQATEAPAHTAIAAAPAKPSAVLRALAFLVGSVLLVAICAALLAAPLLALVGGVWAAVTEVRTIAAIWALARHQDYAAVFAHLATLDTASRVAFLGVSFFALLFALMLLMAGLLGRRWGRLFIAPGLVFTAPTLVCYVVGWLWLTPVAARHGVSPLAQASLAAYMLLDAVVLAAALCDMRPTLRRARRMARLGKRTRPSLPAVRVAGSGGLGAVQVWRTPVAPNARRSSPTPQPTAPSDLMADMYSERPRAYPAPRFALQAPITRPMAAIRIEDVAPTKPSADAGAERDEFAISAEAETWRIFSGEWAAWGADDMALHQEVTLPALGWPADDEDEDGADVTTPAIRIVAQDIPQDQADGAPADSAHVDSGQSKTVTPVEVASATAPITPDTLRTSMDVGEETPASALAAEPAPPFESALEPVWEPTLALVAAAPLTDTATFGALIAIAEAPELADASLTPDAPLAFALAE